ARRLEPEAPRGVTPEHVAAEHAVAHQLAIARGRALLVEGAAGEAPGDVRPLEYLEERGEDLLAGGVEEERRLAVLAGAADRADKVPEEAPRHVGVEGDRHLARREPACAEAGERPLTGGAADAGDSLEVGRVARDRSEERRVGKGWWGRV